MTEMIFPVMGLTTMEAGVMARESSGRVTTTREDTRTERGPSGYCSAFEVVMMGKNSVAEPNRGGIKKRKKENETQSQTKKIKLQLIKKSGES